MKLDCKQISQAVKSLKVGEIIAYPTEGVYGLGCDPDNDIVLRKLLELKQRPVAKGLILVAASFEQLEQYIDISLLSATRLAEIKASWPGAITWVIPASSRVSPLVTGEHSTIAVRVSAHKVVKKLCEDYGKPIVSTSANIAGNPPCLSANAIKDLFFEKIGAVIDFPLGGLLAPTQIIDAITGITLRS